jgi:Domain of unknown function (DUF4349)
MPQLRRPTRRFLFAGSILLLVLILAGCGGSAGMSTSASGNSAGQEQPVAQDANTSSNGVTAPGAPDQLKMPKNVSQQHLIKTLNVTMEAKDTRQVANDIQTWIGNTDPQATSVGTNYNQVSDGVYTITLNFSVEYTLYPKIYSYLSNYPLKDGGQLLSFNETVQDVTNDYVDTQARIKNYQNELLRLRSLMQTAGSLTDVLTLEQRISDVEGDIETTQAHLDSLSNETTMYTINLTIQPIGSATPPIQANSGWNLGQTLRDAFTASLAFAQVLVSFIIWLLAFSVYIIPVIILIVLYRRYRARHQPAQSARPLYYNTAAPGGSYPQSGPTGNRTVPNRATASQQPVPAGVAIEDEKEPEETTVNIPSSED